MKYFLLAIFLACTPLLPTQQTACGQSPEVPLPEYPSTKDRIVFGGSAWLVFGTITEIEFFPVAGYRLSDRFSVLAGPMYSYFHDRRFNYSDNAYGGRALARFFPTKAIYLQGEIDRISFGSRLSPVRREHTYMMAGAGYYNYGGTLELLYIMNNPANTRYANPLLIRFGYIFYLSQLTGGR